MQAEPIEVVCGTCCAPLVRFQLNMLAVGSVAVLGSDQRRNVVAALEVAERHIELAWRALRFVSHLHFDGERRCANCGEVPVLSLRAPNEARA